MPQALNVIKGEQWDQCDRCSLLFPLSALTMQKGMQLCRYDLDKLEVERRPIEIMRVLSNSLEEGTDRRNFNRAFFQGYDTEIS